MSQYERPPAETPSEEIIPHAVTGSVVESSEQENRPTRSGCLWGIAGAIGCLVIALIIPVTLVLLGVTTFGGLLGSIGIALGAPPQANVVSTQTIIQGIQPMGQLVTVSAQLAKADVNVSVTQGTLNACGFGANHVVQGTIEAGVDLIGLDEDSLAYDVARETYVLIVPEPQLTSCRIDEIRQYSRSFTTCSVDWDEARVLANYTALNEFRDDALEGGILERAQSETRLVLGNFVRLLTGHPVEIVFQPREDAALTPSCNPEMPVGWRRTEAGAWTK